MTLHVGTESRVYRNLHTGNYSIQQRQPRKGWRVVGHRASAYLTDVTFRVYDTGRQRVLREKKKNVHAFVVGTYLGPTLVAYDDLTLDYAGVVPITYNPFKGGFFYDRRTNQEVTGADEVWITRTGVFARGTRYGKQVVDVTGR